MSSSNAPDIGAAARTMRRIKDQYALTSGGPSIGVDRERKTIFGRVAAQVGVFKSEEGRFTLHCLQEFVRIWPSDGLRSRFGHPNPFTGNDGLGNFLGRNVNPRVQNGKLLCDLILNPTSFNSPFGNLGQYVLDRVSQDPDSLASSFAARFDKFYAIKPSGEPLRDANGAVLPQVWFPMKLTALDVVDTGDAADGFLATVSSLSLRERELKLLKLRSAI